MHSSAHFFLKNFKFRKFGLAQRLLNTERLLRHLPSGLDDFVLSFLCIYFVCLFIYSFISHIPRPNLRSSPTPKKAKMRPSTPITLPSLATTALSYLTRPFHLPCLCLAPSRTLWGILDPTLAAWTSWIRLSSCRWLITARRRWLTSIWSFTRIAVVCACRLPSRILWVKNLHSKNFKWKKLLHVLWCVCVVLCCVL